MKGLKGKIAVLCLALLTTSGCIPIAVTGAATTGGVVTAQERSAGNAVDDAGIKLTIDNLFINHDIAHIFKNVNVHVCEGRVLLTGAVDTPELKEQASKLAWQARGAREVINEIQVGSNGIVDFARDTWISAQIRSKILVEKNVRSINYNVETVNGIVYLLGIAQDDDELKKVTYIAATTKYVKQVISHVVMKDDPRRRDYLRHDEERASQSPHSPQSTMPSSGQPETQSGGGQPESQQQSQPEAAPAQQKQPWQQQ